MGGSWLSPSLTVEDACYAWAQAYNTLDLDILGPILAKNVHYVSQWTAEALESRQAYLAYLNQKFKSFRLAGGQSRVWTEVARLPDGRGACCVVAQSDGSQLLLATVLARVNAGKAQRFDMCFSPDPKSVERTGEYPGKESAEFDALDDRKLKEWVAASLPTFTANPKIWWRRKMQLGLRLFGR